MFTLIQNGVVYTPQYLGPTDLLIWGEKIVSIGKFSRNDLASFVGAGIAGACQVIDAKGLTIMPGFVDQHVHIAGGGGEGGPSTRTPEITIDQLVGAGITTVVGLLGFDDTTRSMEGLLAKARSLEKEGISTFLFSGSYSIPTSTLTGSISRDLFLIDKVIGVGEIAIADHRSSQPTIDSLIALGAQARQGGIVSGKAGVVHTHVGDGKKGLQALFEVVENSDLPVTQFVPTHVNRLTSVFRQAVDYHQKGGYIDLTAGISPQVDGSDALDLSQAIKLLLETGSNLDRVTVSSDSNGSIPKFDAEGSLTSISVGSASVLWKDVKKIITDGIVPLEKAVGLITLNIANLLKLPNKGTIQVGADADLVLLDRELNITTVFAGGKLAVSNGIPLFKGTFADNH